jgi:hypothetical protein
LRLPRKFLQRPGDLDLQVHFRLGPGGGLLNLVSENDGTVGYDFVKGLFAGIGHRFLYSSNVQLPQAWRVPLRGESQR